MIRSELINQISIDAQSSWLIFNIRELRKAREAAGVELWGWTWQGNFIRERSVRTDSPNPRDHRRDIFVKYWDNSEQPPGWRYRWVSDLKVIINHDGPRVTDRIEILGADERIRNYYDLSPFLQNLITQAVLRPHIPDNLVELQTKIQRVHFVEGRGYNSDKPWLVFNKQWLYEKIEESFDEDFFIIQGTCDAFLNKTDAELKRFLQQEGYLPVEQNSRQEQENHAQSNGESINNNTFSNSSANSGSYSYSASNFYSNSPSEDSFTSSSETYASENRETRKSSLTNSQPINSSSSSSQESSLSSSSAAYASGGSNSNQETSSSSTSSYFGGELSGGFTSSSSESKPKSEPTTNQPNLKPETKPLPKQSNEPFNLTNQTELTKQKQQIIEQIQEKLNQNTNLNLPDNWKQEIEQIQNLKAVIAYQKNLSALLEKQKNLSKSEIVAETNNQTPKNFTGWMIGIGLLLSGLILVGYLFWKKKTK